MELAFQTTGKIVTELFEVQFNTMVDSFQVSLLIVVMHCTLIKFFLVFNGNVNVPSKSHKQKFVCWHLDGH